LRSGKGVIDRISQPMLKSLKKGWFWKKCVQNGPFVHVLQIWAQKYFFAKKWSPLFDCLLSWKCVRFWRTFPTFAFLNRSSALDKLRKMLSNKNYLVLSQGFPQPPGSYTEKLGNYKIPKHAPRLIGSWDPLGPDPGLPKPLLLKKRCFMLIYYSFHNNPSCNVGSHGNKSVFKSTMAMCTPTCAYSCDFKNTSALWLLLCHLHQSRGSCTLGRGEGY